MADPRKTAPPMLPNYPYLNKFTREQVTDALARKDRLVELLMDPVGPDGTLINLPVDMLHILAFHLAYAGADTHTDERQLIESRVVREEGAMFEMYEWRARGEWPTDPDPQAADTVEAEAAGLAAQMRQQLTPEIRAALATILAEEAAAAAPEISERERAENMLIEQRELPTPTNQETP